MGAFKFNPTTCNNEVGVYFVKSRRVVIGTPFGEMASWIKSLQPGTIVFYNSLLDETSVIETEAGEALPIVCDKILTSATIDGSLETTTVVNMFWITTPQQLSKW